MARKPAPKEIAFWRYEQIEEALDENLHPLARGKILGQIAKTPLVWPSGKTKRISLATLYRWLECYQKGGLEALQPKPRCDRGKSRSQFPDEVVCEALSLLTEDPGASYNFLLAVLKAKFPDTQIARSTLQQRLAADPSYEQIKRTKVRTQRRTRFVAKAPHDIWHLDAKGPVNVLLKSGMKIMFHIMTILDDATRAVLAAIVTLSANLAAAVRVFRMAALRWGLPAKLYADRASIFDSVAFRTGLAGLGDHRIPTKARNPEAHGKIEAYHRTLVLWFTKRLPSQVVVDLDHLQQLLDGIIHSLYQTHKHRSLKTSPEKALAGTVSPRSVPPTRLYDAFLQEKRLKAHYKTGEVEIHQTTYLVPDCLRGKRLTFLIDPPDEVPPLVIDPITSEHLPLRLAAIKPQDIKDKKDPPQSERWGAGPLQAIYDNWRGRRLPLAEPGFGLPEIYALLSQVAGRHVPQTDAEAALVQRVYRNIGPFSRKATEAAMHAIATQLGPQRPIKTYLDALVSRVSSPSTLSDPRRS